MNGWRWVVILTVLTLLIGCASTPENGITALREARAAVWTITDRQDGLDVSVSKVRNTIMIAGATAAVIGAGVDATRNSGYRNQIMEALGAYKPGQVFRAKLDSALARYKYVAPMGGTIAYDSRREAELAYYERLGRDGADLLLHLELAYGIYGTDGTLAAGINGKLIALPRGTKLWARDIEVTLEPALAGAPLRPPSKADGRGFSKREHAIEQWTDDGGQTLRNQFEATADAAVTALLCALGLSAEPLGFYHLGRIALNNERFDEAIEYFDRALGGHPENIDTLNAKSVALSYYNRLDEAIDIAERITEIAPAYGPAWFNLAYWYAIDKNEPSAAKPCYERALALGMNPENKIEKAFAPPSAG